MFAVCLCAVPIHTTIDHIGTEQYSRGKLTEIRHAIYYYYHSEFSRWTIVTAPTITIIILYYIDMYMSSTDGNRREHCPHKHITSYLRRVCVIVEKLASNESCARYIEYYYYYFCIVIDFECVCVCVYLADGKKLLTGQLRRTVLQFPHTIYLNARCSGGGARGKASRYIYIIIILYR